MCNISTGVLRSPRSGQRRSPGRGMPNGHLRFWCIIYKDLTNICWENKWMIMRGSKICDPKIFHFGMWIMLSWRQLRPSRLKNFDLSLPKRICIGDLAQKELLSEITFYLKDPSVWQGKHLIAKHFLFLLSCELPFSPLKLWAPIPFLVSRWHTSLNCPTCPWVSYFLQDSHMNVITFVFLLWICLLSTSLIDQPKELRKVEEIFFLPYNQILSRIL